ncbi:hypothetical protein C8Q76DRAFT_797424 [Earliella scabrosa]|nr:hypothetical protein C8Q76DRAFT_797424 [Earliella scabrosa]
MSSDDSALALSTAECDAMISFLEKRDLKDHPLVQDFLEKLKAVAVAVSGTGWHQAASESTRMVSHADEPANVDSSESSDLDIQKVEPNAELSPYVDFKESDLELTFDFSPKLDSEELKTPPSPLITATQSSAPSTPPPSPPSSPSPSSLPLPAPTTHASTCEFVFALPSATPHALASATKRKRGKTSGMWQTLPVPQALSSTPSCVLNAPAAVDYAPVKFINQGAADLARPRTRNRAQGGASPKGRNPNKRRKMTHLRRTAVEE